MALVDANGQAVLDLALCLPLVGAWHADLRVDAPDTITGPVTISIDQGSLTLNGSASRGSAYVGTSYVRVVAGAGGLGKTARARHYNQTSVRIVLADLLSDAGETLSMTASSAILAHRLDAWTTAALPVGELIGRLLGVAAPPASWRMLPNGQLWIGTETWPDSGIALDAYQITDENPAAGEAILAPDAPLLLPGTALAGRRVGYIQHHVNEGGVRSQVWFESQDRVKVALAAAVKAVLPPIDYFASYWARVIAQRDGTIDVQIENPTISARLPSMSGVPLTMPAAGAAVQMAAAGRVLIGWSGGDPSKPFAFAPSADTVMLELVLPVITGLFLGDRAGAEPIIKGASFASALATFLTALTTYAAAIQSIADPSGLATTAVGAAATAFGLATSAALTTKTRAT